MAIDFSIFSPEVVQKNEVEAARKRAEEKNADEKRVYLEQANQWLLNYMAHAGDVPPAPLPPLVLHIADNGTEVLGPDTVAPKVEPPVGVKFLPSGSLIPAGDPNAEIKKILDQQIQMFRVVGEALQEILRLLGELKK